MKRDKILYWITTGLVSLSFLMASMMYLTKSPELMASFASTGLPEYFVMILGTAKLLGGLAVLNPWSAKLREWSYAGFTFVLIGATWVHIATGTPFIAPVINLLLVGLSYFFHQRVKAWRPQAALA